MIVIMIIIQACREGGAQVGSHPPQTPEFHYFVDQLFKKSKLPILCKQNRPQFCDS